MCSVENRCSVQIGLFQCGAPVFVSFPCRRIELGRGAWIEWIPGWLQGPTPLFDRLLASTSWEAQQRQMYERVVDVPRLMGVLADPIEPLLLEARGRIEAHTGWTLDRVSLSLYRDGNDSVAWHGDRIGELRADSVMAILSLGGERRFLVRPAGGGRSQTFRVRGGDLMILGGTIHETFDHAVPKERYAEPRIAVMFRPSARPG